MKTSRIIFISLLILELVASIVLYYSGLGGGGNSCGSACDPHGILNPFGIERGSGQPITCPMVCTYQPHPAFYPVLDLFLLTLVIVLIAWLIKRFGLRIGRKQVFFVISILIVVALAYLLASKFAPGTVEFSSSQDDFKVSIGSAVYDSTGISVNVKLKPGTYDYEASKNGFVSEKNLVDISAFNKQKIKIEFSKGYIAGQLYFDQNPALFDNLFASNISDGKFKYFEPGGRIFYEVDTKNLAKDASIANGVSDQLELDLNIENDSNILQVKFSPNNNRAIIVFEKNDNIASKLVDFGSKKTFNIAKNLTGWNWSDSNSLLYPTAKSAQKAKVNELAEIKDNVEGAVYDLGENKIIKINRDGLVSHIDLTSGQETVPGNGWILEDISLPDKKDGTGYAIIDVSGKEAVFNINKNGNFKETNIPPNSYILSVEDGVALFCRVSRQNNLIEFYKYSNNKMSKINTFYGYYDLPNKLFYIGTDLLFIYEGTIYGFSV